MTYELYIRDEYPRPKGKSLFIFYDFRNDLWHVTLLLPVLNILLVLVSGKFLLC